MQVPRGLPAVAEAQYQAPVLLGSIGSILGWADRKGTTEYAGEVSLSRKVAKSRRGTTGPRSQTTKAATHVDRLRAADAELKKKLAEALEQQAATSEVLRVISTSPGELEPVFRAMLENAVRVCDAKFGTLFRYDGEFLHLAAGTGTPSALAEFQRRRGPFRTEPGTLHDRVVR